MASLTYLTTNLILLFLVHGLTKGNSTKLTVNNKCSITVFPAIFHGVGTSFPSNTGFALPPGETNVFNMPPLWSGHVWGRTHCSYDSNGKFFCLTGDCASSTIECDGRNSSSPATLAEFKLDVKSSGFDYFCINVVNGYNLPMAVEPKVGKGVGHCMKTSCMIHLKKICPSELRVISEGDCIGCKSACDPLSKDCNSEFLAKACPNANVNATKTFQSICASTDYTLTFCPIPSLEPVENSGGRKKKGSTINNKLKKLLRAILAWLKKNMAVAIAGAITTSIAATITIRCIIQHRCCKCSCCIFCCPRGRKTG